MIHFLQRFNPFYFPQNRWEEKKYITLNYFKGYQCFDLHYWPPDDRIFLNGDEHNSKRIMMFGITIFYLRLELFFDWNHKGRCWNEHLD